MDYINVSHPILFTALFYLGVHIKFFKVKVVAMQNPACSKTDHSKTKSIDLLCMKIEREIIRINVHVILTAQFNSGVHGFQLCGRLIKWPAVSLSKVINLV